jgi:hypothetical protein
MITKNHDSSNAADTEYYRLVSNICKWLKENNLEALVKHVNTPLNVSVRPRSPKKSRLTGEPR